MSLCRFADVPRPARDRKTPQVLRCGERALPYAAPHPSDCCHGNRLARGPAVTCPGSGRRFGTAACHAHSRRAGAAALLSILCFQYMVNISVGLDIGTGYAKVSGNKKKAVFPTLCAMGQAKSVRDIEDMDISADGGSGIVERVGNDAVGLDLRREWIMIRPVRHGLPYDRRGYRHGRAPCPQADRRKARALRDMRRRHVRRQKIQEGRAETS